MTMRSALFALSLCFMIAPLARADGAAGQITVEVLGLHNTKGQVFVALFRSKDGFPDEPGKAVAGKKVAIKDKQRVNVVFDNVPAGPFALSVFHDENGNSKMERGALGIPKEGWGASRDAKANFGPPSWDDAKLALGAGEHKHIVVHLRY
jgi:uncharacterized protein (DUF2141 family)